MCSGEVVEITVENITFRINKFSRWSHKQFNDAVRLKYFEDEDVVRNFYKILSEYFLGTWSKGVAKPYRFTQQQRAKFGIKEREGQADRKVAAQPLVYLDKDGHLSRFNLRKFSELPYHLIRAS